MEKKIMSVGFVDLSGYAAFSEKTDPVKVFDMLQYFYNFIGGIIVGQGGKIRKYIGDAVMFSFDDAEAAVAAATELAQFKRTIEPFTLEACVSVATGEVVMGKIGHKSMIVEDIFGSTVNRAAILQKEASKNDPKLAFDDETKKVMK